MSCRPGWRSNRPLKISRRVWVVGNAGRGCRYTVVRGLVRFGDVGVAVDQRTNEAEFVDTAAQLGCYDPGGPGGTWQRIRRNVMIVHDGQPVIVEVCQQSEDRPVVAGHHPGGGG